MESVTLGLIISPIIIILYSNSQITNLELDSLSHSMIRDGKNHDSDIINVYCRKKEKVTLRASKTNHTYFTTNIKIEPFENKIVLANFHDKILVV